MSGLNLIKGSKVSFKVPSLLGVKMAEVGKQLAVKNLMQTGFGALLCLSLMACSITGARPVPNTELLEGMQTMLEEAEASYGNVGDASAVEQGLDELVPGLSISDEMLVPVEDRFNIAANEEPAREFFNNLVAGTEFGVLVSPDLEGAISISLPNVTIDEVMNAVREAYGFTISRRGNIYQIQQPELETRIFTIDYVNITRNGTSSVSVSSGNSGSNSTSGGGASAGSQGGGSTGNVGGGASSGVSGGASGGSGGQVSTNTGTNFWTDLEQTLKSLITEGTVMVQSQIGMAMVTASPRELDRVQEYITRAQGILSREVTVQIQFLEVVLNKGYQSAIDFDTFGADGVAGTNQDVQAGFRSSLENSIDGISNPLTITTDFTDFGAVFRLLESRGTTQVLSSPSLKVMNNQKAVFQDGDQEYFQTSSGTSTVSTGQSVSQNTNNTLQSFFSGISMDITPQISDDGSITLHVHPTITTVTEQSKPVGGEQVPTPKTSVRELDSVIRAEDGKIVVLGGLAYERTVDDAAGIPYASDLPGIGAAFDQRRRSTVKSEFIILLRPVINTDESEQQLLRARKDRLNEINRDLDPFKTR